MSWFRLDDEGAFHAKVIKAGNEAYGAWCRAGQWSSHYKTNGHIPRDVAIAIGAEELWRKLVTVKLAHDAEDGWEIHDFLVYNPSADEIEAARSQRSEARSEAGRRGGVKSASSRRARAKRSGAATEGSAEASEQQTSSNHHSKNEATGVANEQQAPKQRPKQNEAPIPIPIPEIPPEPPRSESVETSPSPTPPPTPSRFEESFWKSAFADAVSSTLGKPWGFPDKQISGLRRSVEAHCPSPASADGWIRETAAEFVRAVQPKAAIWSSFGPDGFLRWLNAGRPTELETSSQALPRPGKGHSRRPPAPWRSLDDDEPVPRPDPDRPRTPATWESLDGDDEAA